MPAESISMLVVDDDPLTRELMSQIFTGLGHSVTTAADGFTALVEIRRHRPDIILSDLNMPGMSGFELLSVVRRRFPAIHVIAMSGAFSGEAIQPGVAADAFYEKPSQLPILLDIVSNMAASTLPPARDGAPPSPIWILSNGHTAAGKGAVTIVCPECCRTYSQVIEESSRLVHETDCIYCKTLIHYAILAPTDAAAPQAFQSKPVLEFRPRISVANYYANDHHFGKS